LPSTVLRVGVDGQTFACTLADLLAGSRCHAMGGWLSEVVHVHRAVPETAISLNCCLDDAAEVVVGHEISTRGRALLGRALERRGKRWLERTGPRPRPSSRGDVKRDERSSASFRPLRSGQRPF